MPVIQILSVQKLSRVSFRLSLSSLTITALLSSGCSLGIGSEEYGCSGLPRGVQCHGTREVYMNRKQYGMWTGLIKDETSGDTDTGNARKGSDGDSTAESRNLNGITEIKLTENREFSSMNSRDEPSPAFIRTRDDIMITVIAPYEDDRQNLHDRSVVYTNLHNGTWGVGIPSYGTESSRGGHGAEKVTNIRVMPYREIEPPGKQNTKKSSASEKL